ncbi:amino acid permease [Streptomyces sp. TLI_171]|uniref:amino acid permease n=1 Tax=Streptomyces sp. TLI_171 TaxID=1938859 RepID=UPI000C19FF31|nr:amino acid permease [Streptomyces sp. TLI_171]RKE21946.1 amino acid/polyamine/organocation transporter (APC superfamily) [Streptomyces sp. TLI_171]
MSPAHAAPSLQSDEEHLRRLGYEPKLSRRMGEFGNFASSFSVISILSGCMTMFAFGLNAGGPTVMFWGWIGVGAMVMFVGAALAEVTSAYPTSGALFYMAHALGGPRWGFLVGWLNLLGLIGGICGIDYGAASFVGALLNMQFGYEPTALGLLGIFAVILLLHAGLNLRGVRLVSVLNSVSVWWHLGGVALIVGALAVVPDHHNSADWLVDHFVNNTGWSNPIYVSALGLLLAQYTFSGYDASAHMSEETTKASIAAPRGIVRSIWVSWIAGAVLLAGLVLAIGDYDTVLNSPTGVPPAQIFLDALGPAGAKALLLVVIVAQLFCGNAETAASSRMVFAFARDKGLPGSEMWSRVSERTGTPVAGVWLSVVAAFVLALPSLWSPVAYGAVTAINVVGMTPAYAVPVYLRLRKGSPFRPGPWNLGRRGRLVGWIAVGWVALVTVLVCLPQSYPVNVSTFNYAPVAAVAALALAALWWRRRGRYDYAPPVQQSAELVELSEEVV